MKCCTLMYVSHQTGTERLTKQMTLNTKDKRDYIKLKRDLGRYYW